MKRAVTAVALVAALTGCGVTAQSAPEPITGPPGAGPRATDPPDAAATGRETETLYFIDGDRITKVTRHVTMVPDTHSTIVDLIAGPDDAEVARGYTSALLGDSLVDSVTVTNGYAVVALTSPFADTARNDAVLAYGQLVCTLTALPAINGVTFTTGGQPVAVPRGDGQLSQVTDGQPVPLTASDYTDRTVS